MSRFEMMKLTCEKCGEIFDCKVYTSINVQLNPELKEKVINGSIYEYVCPKCGHKHFRLNSILYHDMEKKYMVQSGTFADLMLGKDLYKNAFNDDFGEIISDYKYYGATSPKELSEKILLLDKDYDPNVIQILKLMLEYQYVSESKNQKDFRLINDVFIDLDKEDKLHIVLDISNENDPAYIPVEIVRKPYEDFSKGYIDRLSQIDGYVFDRQAALKLLSFTKETAEEAKQNKCEFLICENEYGETDITFVQHFNEGKFAIGDKVTISIWDSKKETYNLTSGIVKKIINMSDYEFPYSINDLNISVYKMNDVTFETVLDSDANLNNDELTKAFQLYKENRCNSDYFPYNLVESENAIIGTITTSNLSEDEINRLMQKGTFNADELKTVTKYARYVDEKGMEYLSIYLNQSDVIDEGISKLVLKFNEIFKLFFNSVDKFNGICINPNTDKVIISIDKLINYSFDKIMTRNNHMKEFIKTLNEKEIKYLGNDRFNTISKVYLEGKTLDIIKKEDNLSDDDIKDRLGNGYSRIKKIILSRLGDNCYFSFNEERNPSKKVELSKEQIEKIKEALKDFRANKENKK